MSVQFNFFPTRDTGQKTYNNACAPATVVTNRGNIVIAADGTVTLPCETLVTFYTPKDGGRNVVERFSAVTKTFTITAGTAARLQIKGVGSFGVSLEWPLDYVLEDAIHHLKGVPKSIVHVGMRATSQEMAFGNPVGYLMDTIMETGLEATAKRILSSTEFGLNGTGLKLYISHSPRKFRITVHGDQFQYYPVTGPAIEKILDDAGFTSTEM